MSSILFLVLFHFKCSKFVYRVGRTRAAHHSITTGEDFLQALLNVDFSKLPGDFPRGTVVKNLPANARGQFDPWSRKILRGLTAPNHNYRAHALEVTNGNKRNHHNEKPMHRI